MNLHWLKFKMKILQLKTGNKHIIHNYKNPVMGLCCMGNSELPNGCKQQKEAIRYDQLFNPKEVGYIGNYQLYLQFTPQSNLPWTKLKKLINLFTPTQKKGKGHVVWNRQWKAITTIYFNCITNYNYLLQAQYSIKLFIIT